MSEQKKRVAEVLRMAIKGEQDGYFFYNLLAEKTTNKEARRKLKSLRDDERRHKATLLEMYDKHVGGEVGELPAKGITALAEVFRKGHLEEHKTEMDFINLAIEAELAATRYYQQERDLVDDVIFRDIFDQLAGEEHNHYELLMAEKEALSGNYYWFDYGDTSPQEH
ncbi:MAG: ferritin family protein [Candidatus Zixiibacteriota bacterium]|nr:MAG: ferritin family protein [candidate division Zixibacteria bacterium]